MDKQYKIIIVGESTVGKTSLIQRYMFQSFEEHTTQPTLAVEFKVKQVTVSSGVGDQRDPVKLHVWDTAGQERFRQITRMYYRESHGVIVCFDITNSESFDACSFWVKDLTQNAPAGVKMVLCGLKSDLSSQRQVDHYKAEEFCKSNGMQYFEASAKTGDRVDEVFQQLAQTIANGNQKKVQQAPPAHPV